MTKLLQKLFAVVLICCAFLGSSNAWGQVNLQQSPYTENFNTLSSGYPSGWTGKRAAGTSTIGEVLTPIASDGSSTSGAVYSVGLSTDRAMGSLASGSTIPVMGAVFTNNSGNTLNQIKISAVSEQWKTGSSSAVDERVIFEYSLNATDISDAAATWVKVSSLDLVEILTSTTTAAAVDGNASANKRDISADLTSLDWQVGKNMWIRWTDANDTGSDGMYAVDDFKIEFVSASTAPIISAPSALNLGEILVNNSVTANYTVSASNLTGNVTITAPAPFQISKSSSEGFASTIIFTPAELQTNQKVYVRISPTTTGTFSGEITHKSNGATDVGLLATVLSYSSFEQNFNTCSNGPDITGGWSQFSVVGAQTWACTNFGKEGSGVQMSGYFSGNNPNVDWLISPKLDINSFTIPLVSVNYRTKYAGDALEVKVSTNYSGSGDPTTATWTTIKTLPADDADVWMNLENLSLGAYKSANTYLAFVYTSTNTSAARWTLDNFEVKNENSYLATSNPVMYFGETAVNNATAPKQFTFKAEGYTAEVVLTAPNHFELSKTGEVYTSSLNYSIADAAALNTVFVRFKPTSAVASAEGAIVFKSDNELNTTVGKLSGSSILKVATLDVTTWNLEWFGSASNGPSDEPLQYANAKRVISEINPDIIALQEIVDEAKARELAQELGYTYVSKKMSWQASNDQVVAFMYNPQVATIKKEKVILSKLYEDIKAGRTTLEGYPNNNSNLLWASGRLPYMVQFEVSIGGIKQLYNLVNIHAKANSGDDMVQYNRRKYDVQVLKDSLDAQYANANLIILGDYNDDVDVSVVGSNNPSTYSMFVSDNNRYVALTYDLSLTGAATYESGSFKSFLDHQIISKSLEDEYIANSLKIESQLLENINNFRTTTSDHLPVTARFYISSEVTTGIAKATKGMFRIYPNPFVTNVKLELPARVAMLRSITLAVYGIEGRRLMELKGSQEAVQQQLNNNLDKLNKGLYIIKIEAGNEFYQTRMLKQ